MRTYTDAGTHLKIGGMTIPKDQSSSHYKEALAEVAAGSAEIVTPTLTLAEAKRLRKVLATEKRQEIEVAGFLWQRAEGEIYYIATDRVSQGKIDAERQAAKDEVRRNGDKWKCGNPATGLAVFVALSNAEIIAMSTAARNRTSDAFNREGEIHAAIDACSTVEQVAAVDIATGWPR